MGKSILLLALVVVALCGCARHYVITLSNGSQLGTIGKPRLKGGFYVFKDALGRESYIGVGRVAEIAPASMVHQPATRFRPNGGK
jgi:hypothetical protein